MYCYTFSTYTQLHVFGCLCYPNISSSSPHNLFACSFSCLLRLPIFLKRLLLPLSLLWKMRHLLLCYLTKLNFSSPHQSIHHQLHSWRLFPPSSTLYATIYPAPFTRLCPLAYPNLPLYAQQSTHACIMLQPVWVCAQIQRTTLSSILLISFFLHSCCPTLWQHHSLRSSSTHAPYIDLRQGRIYKPKHPIFLLTSDPTISPIPHSYNLAFLDPLLRQAMLAEYTTLIKNGTCDLVPRPLLLTLFLESGFTSINLILMTSWSAIKL